GPDQRDVLPPLEPQLGVVEQDHRPSLRAIAHLQAPVGELEDHTPRPPGFGEGELEPPLIAGVALDPLHLRELLDPRLRLAGLARLEAEALDEALHALDLRPLRLDRLAECDLPGSL